jgi:hypothetical protein
MGEIDKPANGKLAGAKVRQRARQAGRQRGRGAGAGLAGAASDVTSDDGVGFALRRVA